MIAEILQHISQNYLQAKTEVYAKHHLAGYIRRTAKERLKNIIEPFGMIAKGSPGQDDWSASPWIAVFYPAITTGARGGYYIVYLFAADMKTVVLSMNQGTTAIRDSFKGQQGPKGRARKAMRNRAEQMRLQAPGYSKVFSNEAISLESKNTFPRDYEAAHAFGITYDTANLPSEEVCQAHLEEMMRLYLRIWSGGGTEDKETARKEAEDAGYDGVKEIKKYSQHRSIDRDSSAARKAKKAQGYVCKVCDLDFEKLYGPIGKNYIEAHHLTPLSELPDGVPVNLDPVEDFAVLCANCHRMIHRKDAPRTVEKLRKLKAVPRLKQFNQSLGLFQN